MENLRKKIRLQASKSGVFRKKIKFPKGSTFLKPRMKRSAPISREAAY